MLNLTDTVASTNNYYLVFIALKIDQTSLIDIKIHDDERTRNELAP
jgi:hypothetical protein